ncbi:ornithine carbamoyltransferase [Plantactinospora sp. B5E13]|uniref:ornithine carbamoyltransferase n=1 Tax=Plantactinospora sp. B5E13 TaxID=3153758 RepID=UPI00325C611C
MTRHLISISDLTDDDLHGIVRRGAELSTGAAVPSRALAGRIVGIYFRRTSTRTRTAFSSGALRLGGQIIAYGPDDLQTRTGETVEDTGRVFAGMLDLLVARTADSPSELRAYAGHGRMGVVNAMTADEHPTQALTDLTTLLVHFGRLEGLRVRYVGEGNNTATALALALTRIPGTELDLHTPPGYGLPAGLLHTATEQARRYGARISERHDMTELGDGVDVVYTTRWQTTGSSKADPEWRRVFAPFQVDDAVLGASPKAVFMHDLPAHRGEEVTASVLDGPASIAFGQAENKMHSAMAVLEWCAAGGWTR